MSRVHSSQYNNNGDFAVNNSENANKMLRNKRFLVDTSKPRSVEAKVTRDKSANRAPNQLAVARPVPKVVGPIVRVEEPRRKPSSHDLVHKEVFNNNMATVEVTVRTVGHPKGSDGKPTIEEVREPWGKILTTRRSEETMQSNLQCSFGSFDPLRTLHFLSKELQLKLHNLCPGDPSVHQIVNDMQNAMQRLPPDVLSQFKASDAYPFTNTNSGDNEPPTNLKRTSRYDDRREERKNTTQTQTVIIGDIETKKMQQQLEDSALKLEASCKEMENACSKLQQERNELEALLLVERETVVSLRKELRECVSEKDEKMNNEIRKLTTERDLLIKQLKEMKTVVESQTGHAAEDLRVLVEELRTKQLAAEQENSARRNELTIMKLEKDKITVLLDSRDKQLRELRNELECIQNLVSTQLMEFKAKPTFSTTSTMSDASQIWNAPSSIRGQKMGKSVHEIFFNNDAMRKMLMNKELQIAESGTITTINADDIIKEQNALKLENEDNQEIPQREKRSHCKIKSEMTISDATLSASNEFMHKLSSPSIKDMFAELKRQAFKKIELSLPPNPHKITDATPADSQAGLESRGSLSS